MVADDPLDCKPMAPSTLTREQVEQIRDWFNDPGTRNISTVAKQLTTQLIDSDAAQRATIERLEQELEEYRSIAENIGAGKAVSQLEQSQQQLAALRTERDAIQRKHDELGAIIIANKVQVQSVQRNRDLQAQLTTSQARCAELEAINTSLNLQNCQLMNREDF